MLPNKIIHKGWYKKESKIFDKTFAKEVLSLQALCRNIELKVGYFFILINYFYIYNVLQHVFSFYIYLIWSQYIVNSINICHTSLWVVENNVIYQYLFRISTYLELKKVDSDK